MSDDYLWNKHGEDAEISDLENALQIFRFQKTEAPKLPAAVLRFEKPRRRSIFTVSRALAACVLFSVVLTGMWVFISKPEVETAGRMFGNGVYEPDENGMPSQSAPQPELPPAVFPGSKRPDTLKINGPRRNLRPQKAIYRSIEKRSKTKKAEPAVNLTEEERAAYEKLMLALSITSSKLKIVRDKVQNLDEQTAIYTDKKTDTRKK